MNGCAMALLAAGLAGCFAGPRVGERVDAGPVDPVVGFRALQDAVFTPTCAVSQCHAGAPPPRAPMSLEPEQAYASLVDAPSFEAPALSRVTPGAPARSYLLFKLRGTAASVGGTGTRMPLGKDMLSDSMIQAIESWVARGAPND